MVYNINFSMFLHSRASDGRWEGSFNQYKRSNSDYFFLEGWVWEISEKNYHSQRAKGNKSMEQSLKKSCTASRRKTDLLQKIAQPAPTPQIKWSVPISFRSNNLISTGFPPSRFFHSFFLPILPCWQRLLSLVAEPCVSGCLNLLFERRKQRLVHY